MQVCFSLDTIVWYIKIIHVLVFDEFRGLLHDLTRNVEVNRCPVELSRERIVLLLLRDGYALGIPLLHTAACSLKKLEKVLLNRSLSAGQLFVLTWTPPLENEGQVSSQLLSDLPVQITVEKKGWR